MARQGVLMSHRAALLAALLGVAASGATCKGGDGPPPRETVPSATPDPEPMVQAPPVTEIESLDMALVPPAARADVVRILNETFAYCGCARSVASCLSDLDQCTCPKASQRVADFVVNQFQNGASTEDVESQLLEGFSEGYNKKPFELNATGQPVRGTGPVTIAEFADFRCPHCASTFAVLERVFDKRDDVRLVYYYFPLTSGGEVSLIAAEAAEEARQQGKFWPLASLMYQNQMSLSYESIMRFAGEVGLDTDKLAKALETHVHRKAVLADRRIGQTLGVMSTPSVYINGRPYGLNRTEEVFNTRIDMELERGQCD